MSESSSENNQRIFEKPQQQQNARNFVKGDKRNKKGKSIVQQRKKMVFETSGVALIVDLSSNYF